MVRRAIRRWRSCARGPIPTIWSAGCSKGIRQCGLDVRGKRVLLKPNLVEFDPATVINTDAAVIAAAVEVFHKLGAAEVKIGEGPGHRRDTLDLADDARYRSTIPKFESIFTDLESRRCLAGVGLRAANREFYFPNTVLARRPDRFARQDEDASLGGRDAFDEELLRRGARARSTAGRRTSCTISGFRNPSWR